MTPFGKRLRDLRAERNLTLEALAEEISVSTSYLSGLERGVRGKPSWVTLQRIVSALNIIWDDAEELYELAGLSKPKLTLDTSKLSSEKTLLVNKLERLLESLTEEETAKIIEMLDLSEARQKRMMGSIP